MAVRNGTAEWTDYLARTANVPSYDSNYSFLAWFRVVTNPGSYSWGDLFSLRSESAGVFFFDELGYFYIPGTGVQLYHQAKNDATRVDILGTGVLSTATWYCAGLVRAADNSRLIYLGSLTAALAQDANLTSGVGSRAANPAAQLAIAERRSGVARVGCVKIWTAALTLDELRAEQFKMLPVRMDNLAAWFPFLDTGTGRGRDYSGSGDLTTYGTMTDEDNPPVSYGAAPILIPWAAAASGVTVTPSPAAATAGGVDPTVILGAVTVTPSPAAVTGGGVDPTVILGAVTVTPLPAAATAGGVDPVVSIGGITISPAPAAATGAGVDPVVILGAVTVTPAPAFVTGGGVDPVVVLGAVTVTPAPAIAIAGGVDPSVVIGGITAILAIAGKITTAIPMTGEITQLVSVTGPVVDLLELEGEI